MICSLSFQSLSDLGLSIRFSLNHALGCSALGFRYGFGFFAAAFDELGRSLFRKEELVGSNRLPLNFLVGRTGYARVGNLVHERGIDLRVAFEVGFKCHYFTFAFVPRSSRNRRTAFCVLKCRTIRAARLRRRSGEPSSRPNEVVP